VNPPVGVLAHLSIDRVETRLRDGTPVVIRPVTSEDRELLRRGFARLSDESRLRRFMTPVAELTDEQLDRLTNLDYWDRFAWGAVLPGNPEEGIGVARYVRLSDEPEVAEVAVTVIDDFQGRGLGTVLLSMLGVAARTAGITTFRAYVMEENVTMRDLLHQFGARTRIDSPGVLRLDVPLDPESAPDSPAGRILRAAAARLVHVAGWSPF
jgi:RimJ/RimL family protein N-acetyltransferase